MQYLRNWLAFEVRLGDFAIDYSAGGVLAERDFYEGARDKIFWESVGQNTRAGTENFGRYHLIKHTFIIT